MDKWKDFTWESAPSVDSGLWEGWLIQKGWGGSRESVFLMSISMTADEYYQIAVSKMQKKEWTCSQCADLDPVSGRDESVLKSLLLVSFMLMDPICNHRKIGSKWSGMMSPHPPLLSVCLCDTRSRLSALAGLWLVPECRWGFPLPQTYCTFFLNTLLLVLWSLTWLK